jgi:hypothetical protein
VGCGRRTAILANLTTIWVIPRLITLRERIRASPARAGFGLAGVVVLMSPWAID